jgi:hypothetical protein
MGRGLYLLRRKSGAGVRRGVTTSRHTDAPEGLSPRSILPGTRLRPDALADRLFDLLELLAGQDAVDMERLHELVDQGGEKMELRAFRGMFYRVDIHDPASLLKKKGLSLLFRGSEAFRP